MLVVPNGKFRQLLKKTSAKAVAVIALLILGCTLPSFAAKTPRTLPKESADIMGQMYVQYKGRICPLQTLAKDFTTKLYGAPTYKGLTSEQVFSGWIFYFTDWQKEPIFKIKDKYAQRVLGIEGKYAKMTDFTDMYGKNKLDAACPNCRWATPSGKAVLQPTRSTTLSLCCTMGNC